MSNFDEKGVLDASTESPLEVDDSVLTSLAAQVGKALLEKQQKLTAAESCTGGGIAEAITRIPGSSAWFERSWVTYANAAKTEELGVPADLLAREGAVSEAVVVAMAQGAHRRAGADWAVAVSGIAGPDGGSADKPVGTVWMAWVSASATHAERHYFAGDRQTVRRHTIQQVFLGLLTQMGLASVTKL